MHLVVVCQNVIEDTLEAVERPTEVANLTLFALFNKEVEKAIVDKTTIERLDIASDIVQKVVVDIINLKFLERFFLHLNRVLKTCIREV